MSCCPRTLHILRSVDNLNEGWIMLLIITKNNKKVMYQYIQTQTQINYSQCASHPPSSLPLSDRAQSTWCPGIEKLRPASSVQPLAHLGDLEDDGLGSLSAGAHVNVHVSVLVLQLDGASPVALKKTNNELACSTFPPSNDWLKLLWTFRWTLPKVN